MADQAPQHLDIVLNAQLRVVGVQVDARAPKFALVIGACTALENPIDFILVVRVLLGIYLLDAFRLLAMLVLLEQSMCVDIEQLARGPERLNNSLTFSLLNVFRLDHGCRR